MEKRSKLRLLNNKSRLENISVLKLKPLLKKHKIFTSSMLDDICDNRCNLIDELVTRGPDAFVKFSEVLKEAGYLTEAEVLQNDTTTISKRTCYKIKSEPLGMCLIINNEKFLDGDKRIGSSVDASNLYSIFEKMGFLVLPEENLTAAEMEDRIIKFAKDSKWHRIDSCVVIILSHGKRFDNIDYVSGVDGMCVSKMDIVEIFSNVNSQLLEGKPKILIFQACRGDVEDEGIISQESTDASTVKMKVSSLSDILIVHSALPNYKSYRDHVKGSWLCQDLVQVLSEDYKQHDFETMMKSVTRKIQNRQSMYGRKQGIHLEPINLRAEIHFNKFLTNNYQYLE